MKFATKSIRHYPFHLRHFATLSWEIKNSFFADSADMEKMDKILTKKLVFEGVYSKGVGRRIS